MSLTQAQIQFAAEFVTVMVAAAALALIALRRPEPGVGPGRSLTARVERFDLNVLRWWAAVGLGLIIGAAFLRGSLLATGEPVRWLGLDTLAASVALLPVLPMWWPAAERAGAWRGRSPVALIWVGLLAWTVSGALELVRSSGGPVDVCLVIGAVPTGVAILLLARRSIALRVAASAAATLLLVVLVLSVALSAVISSSVQHDELNRLASREGIENVMISNPDAVKNAAKYVGADLGVSFDQTTPNPIAAFSTGTPSQMKAATTQIYTRLSALQGLQGIGNLTNNIDYSNATGTLVIVPTNNSEAVAQGFSLAPALIPPSCSAGGAGLFVNGNQASIAASYPECTNAGQHLGVAIVAMPINDAYLQGRFDIDPTVSLVLVSGNTVVAHAGTQPSRSVLATAGRLSGRRGAVTTEALGSQFVSVAAVPVASGQRPLTLLLSTPATTVLSTRTQLYRTLFLIALGGTLLALGLAVFTGDRITAGVRRLTLAADRIQLGDRHIRASIPGDDEVAALGSAFDAMLDAVSSQAGALQTAAEDETRLRNRMEAVVAGMSDALVAVDPLGRITDYNRAAEDLVGVPSSAAVGQSAAGVMSLVDEDGVAVSRGFFQPGTGPSAFLGSLRQAGGTVVPVALSAGALRGPAGEVVGTVFVMRDLRREQEVEQMKSEFLSRVGHELRTPLTGIMGYADILLRREVSAERARTWHEEILMSARRLLRIVEMLEFFASSGAGRMALRPEEVDLRALVNGIASSWQERLPPGTTLGRRVAADLPDLWADRRWLALAIDELIDNAVKFSPNGGRILVTAARVAPEVGGYNGGRPSTVEISIRDQGMGMSPADYAVVFSDFVQADTSDTRRFGGLGLGLAIVRRVVEGHGGEVRSHSAVGRGTTVVIAFPVDPGTPPDPAEAAATGGASPAEPLTPP